MWVPDPDWQVVPVLADFRPHRSPDFLQYTTQILYAEVGGFFDQTNEFSYLHTVKSFQLIERVYNYVEFDTKRG